MKVRLLTSGGFEGMDKCIRKIFDAEPYEGGSCTISVRDLVAQGRVFDSDADYNLIFFKEEFEVIER